MLQPPQLSLQLSPSYYPKYRNIPDERKLVGKLDHGEMCLSHQLWSDLSSEIHHFLASIDLASILAKRNVRQIAARQDAIEDEFVRLPVVADL